MMKRAIKIFTICSALFFICLIGWFSYDVITLRNENINDAERAYKILQGELSVLHKIGLDLDAETLRDRFMDMNGRHPSLRAMVIYAEDRGIYFLKADRSDLFTPETISDSADCTEPIYTVGPSRFLLIRRPIPFPMEGIETVYLDALYEIIGRQDILPALRLSCILLASFLVIAVICIILIKSQAPSRSSGTILQEASPVRSVLPKKEPPVETTSSSAPRGKALYSPETGLVWESFLNDRLDNELKRSASFDQDMVLGILKLSKIPSAMSRTSLGAIILERFPFSDLTFEYGDKGFAVIIPNIDLDNGIKEFETFLVELERLCSGENLIISIGLSSRNGRLIDSKRLVKEASKAIEKAEGENKSTIFAFRTDPSKYRDFIASRL